MELTLGKRSSQLIHMKKLIIGCLLSVVGLFAQSTTPVLPHDVVGGIVWFNQSGSPKINGSFFYAIQIPSASTGTYLYNAFDMVSIGKGQIMAVPQTGIAQHVLWLGDKVELFGLMGAGMSFAPTQAANGQPTTPAGTTVTAAFSGGGGLNIAVGKGGWHVQPTVKVINAQGGNTLVGGLGFNWGH